ADRLIRFLDLDGKLLALRYDFTASVARLAATKLADWPTPLRLSYAGKVFRQDPEREGRRREILQVGGELLGEGGVAADVEVLRLIDRKDAAGLAAAAPGALTELPFIIGRREALDRAARVLATAPAPNDAIARLNAIDTALSESERRHVVYDFGEVRGLDYYTGIHFEIFVAGAGTAVGAGGRYDDLIGRFGRPLPAVGLALDLDALATAAP